MAGTAIFGIGNILLGDDGVGPSVAQYLQDHLPLPAGVIVEDLGTPSLALPGYLLGHDKVIFIDAVKAEASPGSVIIYRREDILAADPGIRISPHEPSIHDALVLLEFSGGGPREATLVGIVPESLDGGVQLSERVAAAVPEAARVALALSS